MSDLNSPTPRVNRRDQTSTTDTALLEKLNAAVKAANDAEQIVTTAQAELVSRSKAVGLLLLEAKKLHPAVKDFEAFLKRVQGLKLSRAYDLLRLAGGRTTDEELRKETRERVKKHREKKKLPKPKPVSVTDPDVTEKKIPKPETRVTGSAEVDIEQRRAENAALDDPIEEDSTPGLTAKERWQNSLGAMAGEAISLPAYWTREFGEWEKFGAPSHLVTLAEQAAEAWAEIASRLKSRSIKAKAA